MEATPTRVRHPVQMIDCELLPCALLAKMLPVEASRSVLLSGYSNGQ